MASCPINFQQTHFMWLLLSWTVGSNDLNTVEYPGERPLFKNHFLKPLPSYCHVYEPLINDHPSCIRVPRVFESLGRLICHFLGREKVWKTNESRETFERVWIWLLLKWKLLPDWVWEKLNWLSSLTRGWNKIWSWSGDTLASDMQSKGWVRITSGHNM